MPRFAMIMSIAAFVLFNFGQYRGWSLFSESADAQPVRSANAARTSALPGWAASQSATSESRPMARMARPRAARRGCGQLATMSCSTRAMSRSSTGS